MSLNKKDWKRLQWSIALFVALVTLGTIIVGMAGGALNDADKSNKLATQERDAAHSKAARANLEAEELRGKITVYQTMDARGVIGQEHRLDWIEKIRKIKKERKLIDVSYELEPQKLLDANVIEPGMNGFDIMSSRMKLQMGLLHENDLLDFLGDLRNEIQGYIRVRSCDITHAAGAPAARGPAVQLHADCVLDWITIRTKQ